MLADKKVLLVHDSFTQYGGAERVFAELVAMFPQAQVFAIVSESKVAEQIGVSPNRLKVSWLQPIYKLVGSFQWLFPFIPFVLATSNLPEADVIISSSSSFAKGVKKGKAVHINYCHTPTRFLWLDSEHAFQEIPRVLHWLAKPVMAYVRNWDYRVAQKVDYYIANSQEVRTRIKNTYGKDSEVIYPFIETSFWHPTIPKQNYFLIAGRLQFAKGLDTVVKVFSKLGIPLHVLGQGRYETELKKMAGQNVKFLGRASDETLRDEYSGAKAFIYPQVEDFGIMPLEAASCGTATIGLAKAGSLETVVPGRTGDLYPVLDEKTLIDIVKNWHTDRYQLLDMQEHAEKFSREVFHRRMASYLEAIA